MNPKPDSASKKKTVQTVSVNLSVDEKETPTLPAPPSEALVLRRDPRHAEFKAAVAEVFRENGWRFYWTTPGTDDKLDELLESDAVVTVQQFGRWLQNWVASEDHKPGEHPSYFLPRIYGYSISSINKYGRPHNPPPMTTKPCPWPEIEREMRNKMIDGRRLLGGGLGYDD